MSRISDGLSPASTSSSSRSFGSVASALASSSRLRPATVKACRPAGRACRRDRLRGRPVRRLRALRARAVMQMGADQDVLAHREAGEGLHDLEGARDTAPREAIRRLAGDVLAAIAHHALARLEEAGDDGKQRGLAGAVGADQRGDAALRRRERDGIDRQQAAEAARDALDRQQGLSHGPPPAPTGRGAARRKRRCAFREAADQPARREPDHQHQHAAKDDQVEAGRVAGRPSARPRPAP